MVTFKCVPCSKTFEVGDEFKGRVGKCPACGAVLEELPGEAPTPKSENHETRAPLPEPDKPTGPMKPAPKKSDVAVGCGCLTVIALVIIFGALVPKTDTKGPPPTEYVRPTAPNTDEIAAQAAQQEDRNSRVKKSFSSWDGSHIALTAAIKLSMNDPSSYEHVGTSCVPMGNHFLVTTSFRGKNAFGALVQNSVMAEVDADGKVLEIIK